MFRSERLTRNSNRDLKIVSWNVLAPELLLYFWRSSYGIDTPTNENIYYDDINEIRIINIVDYLRSYDADIICLQEVTDREYDFLNNMSIQDYIANNLGYTIVSESFKQSKMRYNYPPTEQNIRDPNKSFDSGVSTLIKNNTNIVFYENTIATAETFGTSDLFNSGVGSPFTLDSFISNGVQFYLANVHVRMNYPHILKPLNEIYDRITSYIGKIGLRSTIIIGDFNAEELIPARELFASNFYDDMFNKEGYDLKLDHAMIGKNFMNYDIDMYHDMEMPLFEMKLNEPASNSRVWNNPNQKYNKSSLNNKIINDGFETSDHYPVILTLNLSSQAKTQNRSFRSFRNL